MEKVIKNNDLLEEVIIANRIHLEERLETIFELISDMRVEIGNLRCGVGNLEYDISNIKAKRQKESEHKFALKVRLISGISVAFIAAALTYSLGFITEMLLKI